MYTAQKFLSNIKTYTTCLGQGAFGIVLKGIDESDTPSAVKFLFPVDYSDHEKLRREYKVTKDLQHENIVQILGVEEKKLTSADIDKIFKDLPSNEKLAMVNFRCREKANSSYSKTIDSICIKMQLCGSNLRSWLNLKHHRGELHVQIRQTRIVQGLITGLKFLHGNNIIHRDLKPENIMFSRGRYQLPVKIGDFGHSRVIHSDESITGGLTSNVGTPVYTAPEVSGGNYDQQADLYSLGLIILEVGQLIEPSKRRNLFDTLVNDREEDLVQDHPIMAGIKEIIIRLTKRKREERTKSIDEIIDTEAWEEALIHEVKRKGCKPLWDAITSNSETSWIVKTSEEFKLALDYARVGCTINLASEYHGGGFILWENDVEIVGNGSGTVLKDDASQGDVLVVYGSGCTISGVKIILWSPPGILLCGSCIVLNGDMNTVKNVEINSSGGHAGIQISGSHNTVDGVVMNNLQLWGILIESNSNENTISNIAGVDLRHGIRVEGSNNALSEINLKKRIRDNGGEGVWLSHFGSSNTISNLTCSGYFSAGDRWATWDLRIDSSNTTVKHGECGSVRVWGKDVTLSNVNCGELIQIRPALAGINVVNCFGKKLETSDNVGVIDCQFQEIAHISRNDGCKLRAFPDKLRPARRVKK